ncbi:hypothetical protein TVAG_015760 [Trichomonas vaginalis G3]|uniref:Uncharacterized protein n=1 Tax=Trichomonas vaginalis (strain ATCC PRA-98 / G3) TaxID=412133 RepID=A2DP47_TRIV3|nr:hypothetical protein TVAGG3_0908270 [Trichomonas vaginalis G3]EAY17747.1 hypothetical protein TVAG_015760 [Trichomonas vaginalis G3]KAI5484226.1 hypothetical protein TVAGG3_0908270 [Trichomonas vaginalis G3]|eukprot:XP_001329882.1 hypothetical protein [Trichomonas vaginalis G3]
MLRDWSEFEKCYPDEEVKIPEIKETLDDLTGLNEQYDEEKLDRSSGIKIINELENSNGPVEPQQLFYFENSINSKPELAEAVEVEDSEIPADQEIITAPSLVEET